LAEVCGLRVVLVVGKLLDEYQIEDKIISQSNLGDIFLIINEF